MNITVIGVGYLGAVHAACLAELGHNVLGVDTREERIAGLAAGEAPFFEPGLADLLNRGIHSGRLSFDTSLAGAAEFGDVHFVCVGTPQLPGSMAADTTQVAGVIEGLAPHLGRACLVVGKSTVPVGTATGLATTLATLAPAGSAAELAWNPEFLREGRAVRDTLAPDRLVVGVTSDHADEILRSVYAPLLDAGTPYVRTDLCTAELAKVSANAFLATKISFINAMADLCDAVGADVVTLTEVLGYDPRIGSGGLTAGLGFGGGCLPKDLRALLARGTELGVSDSLRFLHEVDVVNSGRRESVVQLTKTLVDRSLEGAHVAVLGAAFKPGTDDVRDSPALAVAARLHSAGALVRVHDPRAGDNARKAAPHLDYVGDIRELCADADIVLHLTEWPQYRAIDPFELRAIVRKPTLIDARNALPHGRWREAGWMVRCLGTGHEPATAGGIAESALEESCES
ncbi:MAG: UDP-glucose/GDP-mannose dehydrogenase family protein [Nocardiopsaceae bacterium]|jgi:UDPglucose 6-dehydrogenase|nr:UDP-glucose/GDP-mannose dehydrogenase family protein [Nocardiopsaceae bacterium]